MSDPYYIIVVMKKINQRKTDELKLKLLNDWCSLKEEWQTDVKMTSKDFRFRRMDMVRMYIQAVGWDMAIFDLVSSPGATEKDFRFRKHRSH